MNTEKKSRAGIALIIILLLAMFGLGVAVTTKAGEEFQYRSFEEALTLAGAENKLVMVFFWADWCVYCAKIRREVFSDPKIHEVFDRDFVAVSVDIENDPGGLAKKYRARAMPTMLFLKPDSEVLGMLPGAVDQETFLKILEYVVENHKNS
jgi:thioredoxin-related protein